MNLKRYIVCSVAVLALVGCSADLDLYDPEVIPRPNRPTVPLKRRPIVPPSKLPRPRVAEVYQSVEGALVVEIAEGAGIATVTITEHDTHRVVSYVVEGEVFELKDMSECAFDVAIDVDGVVEVYTVME